MVVGDAVGREIPCLIGLVGGSRSEEKLLADVHLGRAAGIVPQQVLNGECIVTVEANSVVSPSSR